MSSTPTYKPSFMERIGERYMVRLSGRSGAVQAGDEVHILNPEEQAALRRIERGAVIRACIAGALSGVACALGAVFAWPLLGPDPDHATWGEKIPYYAVTFTVSTVATIIEIAFLYYDSLRSVHRLAHVAGLDLFPGSKEPSAVLRALVRAALEIPNPPKEDSRIDPRRETSKVRLLLVTLLYKAKVTASGIIAKAVVGRLGGRVIARRFLDFVGVPVYSIWDGIVIFRVMRQARLRAIGPSAAHTLATLALQDVKRTPDLDATMLRAIGSAIVLTADYHPNHRFFFNEMMNRFSNPDITGLDNSETFINCYMQHTKEEKIQVLRVLAVACAIDGRLVPRELRLFERAQVAAGLTADTTQLAKLLQLFKSGMPITNIL